MGQSSVSVLSLSFVMNLHDREAPVSAAVINVRFNL